MSLVNPNINDVIATTIEYRSPGIADNVTQHNAIFRYMAKSGNVSVAGGTELRETFTTQENGNTSSYSGFDFLPTGAQDGFSQAQFQWAQYATPIAISGREQQQNSGEQAILNLVEERVNLAEVSLKNTLNRHLYLDGTGNNGKNLTGLGAAVPLSPTNVYGGIDRSQAANAIWQNKKYQASVDGGAVATSATIVGQWNAFMLNLTRGTTRPTVIVCGQAIYAMYEQSLQQLQRFSSADSAGAGFATLSFQGIPVVFDSTSALSTNTAYFLNTDYLKLRTMKGRNFVALDAKQSVNQDAQIKTLAWMGNMTCSGSRFQGIYSNT